MTTDTMKPDVIFEHAEAVAHAPCGAAYSWSYLTNRDSQHRNLARAGWRQTDGHLTTTDPDLVAETANSLCLDVVSDGSHTSLGVPHVLSQA